MKQLARIAAAVAFIVLVAGRAEAFRMEPGLWRFTTMTRMSFSSEAKSETHTACVTPDTADDVLKGLAAGNCKIEDRTETPEGLKWKMRCQDKPSDPPMHGTTNIVTHGEALEGTMDMQLEIDGHRMTFKTTWKGHRLGDCP